ncbi:MAG TPA: ABC transporter permease subunit [Anaerolineales bacterium]|nr:ABC transporter permease subunit [Anaerolineales bacterium]
MTSTALEAPQVSPKVKAPFTGWQKWIGVIPFFLFALFFLILPSARILTGSFYDASGQFTLHNYQELFTVPTIVNAYKLSIQISAVTAVGGGILGFLLAYAVTVGGLPKSLRSILITFSGVASNFAGVPLAFAFVATLGRVGFLTTLLKDVFGIDIYSAGFNLYTFVGLALVYTYFQFPLMVLIMAPALDGLKREWREAAENLGASTFQYWSRVAMPVLLPSILGAMILLFGNAFGAYATAYALTGGRLEIVTIQIGAQIRGDVFHNPGLGYALAMGMVIIMAVSLAAYSWLQSKAEKWLK